MFTMLMGKGRMCQSEGPRVPLQPTITLFSLGYMLVAYDSHDKHPCPLSKIFPHRKIKSYGEGPNDSLQSAKYAVFDNQAACVSTENYVLYQLAHVSPYFNVEIFFSFFSHGGEGGGVIFLFFFPFVRPKNWKRLGSQRLYLIFVTYHNPASVLPKHVI